MGKLPEGILENIKEIRAFWEKYQNPFEKVFEEGYDQYLKANQQQAGIKSYSLVVDLLVDDFINQYLQLTTTLHYRLGLFLLPLQVHSLVGLIH